MSSKVFDQRSVYKILENAASIIQERARNYNDIKDYHNTFKYSQALIDGFPSRYQPYVIMIGIKLARLKALLHEETQVKNEITKDNFIDLINYCALMAERYEMEKI